MSEARPEDTAQRLKEWAEDFSVGRYHLPQYANPGELKADILALVAERDTLRVLLERAADALHDAAWVIREDPHQPPLPPARTYVLPQTESVEAEIRTALAAAGESDKEARQ